MPPDPRHIEQHVPSQRYTLLSMFVRRIRMGSPPLFPRHRDRHALVSDPTLQQVLHRGEKIEAILTRV